MSVEESYLKRKFGFCEISWDIENICLAPQRREWTFNSPDFNIRGLKPTKWRMIIKRKKNAQNIYDVTLILKRLRCSQYSETVRTQFEVECFPIDGGKLVDVSLYKMKDFEVDSEHDIAGWFSCVCCPHEKHPPNQSFQVKLTLLITFKKVEENINPCTNWKITDVSEEFFRLYSSKSMSDFTLLASENKPIKAHKVVLHYRINKPELRESILNGNEGNLSYPESDVNKFLKFLYSGNLAHAVNDPTIFMYKIALASDVQPLIKYFNPDQLQLLTVISAVEFKSFCTIPIFKSLESPVSPEFRLSWTISNFFNRSERFLVSSEMISENMDLRWRWKIYPRGCGNAQTHTIIFLEFCSEITAICLNISFSSNKKPFYSKHKVIRGETAFKKEEIIIRCDDLIKHLKDGSLTLFFRLRYLTSNYYKEIKSIGIETVKSNQLTEESVYKLFYEDMKRVCGDRNYSPNVSKFMGGLLDRSI